MKLSVGIFRLTRTKHPPRRLHLTLDSNQQIANVTGEADIRKQIRDGTPYKARGIFVFASSSTARVPGSCLKMQNLTACSEWLLTLKNEFEKHILFYVFDCGEVAGG